MRGQPNDDRPADKAFSPPLFSVSDCFAARRDLSVYVLYWMTDLRFVGHVRRVPPIVLPDEGPGPVEPLLRYLKQVRLVQDAEILTYIHMQA